MARISGGEMGEKQGTLGPMVVLVRLPLADTDRNCVGVAADETANSHAAFFPASNRPVRSRGELKAV